MNLAFVTQDDPFYIPVFFKRFFELFNRANLDVEIIGLSIQKPLGKTSKIELAKQMLAFYGLFRFMIQSWKYLWWIVEKKLWEMHVWPKSFSVEYFADKNGTSILKETNVNSLEYHEILDENKIDLIVSIAASQIFKEEVLAAPRLGCINIHNAPLPDYRGMMPNFWQMYHGEEYSTMTIHEMVKELDRGRIILQRQTRIESGMTLDCLIKKTKQTNAEALVEVLHMFENEQVGYRNPTDKKGSYFSFPTREDVKEFKKRGYRIA